MDFANIFAYVLGAGALASSLGVVLRRDAVVAAMNLVLAFFCLSGIYLLCGFPFLAALQILVYAGAIMVLFLFVIMLLGVSTLSRVLPGPRSGLASVIALAIVIEGSILGVKLASGNGSVATPGTESVLGVSQLLFQEGLVLPFEITGVILLAAMVAVVVIGRRDLREMSIADFAKERALDPRPLVSQMPAPAVPDGLADGAAAHHNHSEGKTAAGSVA